MNTSTKNKNIVLVTALVIIAGVIGYLQYSKSAGTVSVPAGSADIPLSINGQTAGNASTTLANGASTSTCNESYCASTTPLTASGIAVKNSSIPAATQVSAEIAAEAAKYPRAKELVSPDGFINSPNGAGPDGTPGSAPFKIADLIGKKIIIVDFWTYSCINCQRTIPYLNAWYAKYKDAGLEIIGVETPEFDFEKDKANVQAAVEKYGIKYPVVQDNEMGTWNAYGNLYWPHKYLIDQDGFIVYDHIGEGGYDETEKEIQTLLQEKAAREGKVLDFSGTVATEVAKTAVAPTMDAEISSETYFGAYRNGEFVGNVQAGLTSAESNQTAFTTPADSAMTPGQFYLGGSWNVMSQYIQSEGSASAPSTLSFKYTAKNMYFVAGTTNNQPVTVDIYQDGVKTSTITVQADTLYQIASNPEVESHTIELKVEGSGLEAYTFTFG